ncbi:hypothetical protein HDC90_002139 [Pedobacter sp. AK013]|uniref:carboxypeptidase-like regulatory domain-containing protein n=1 Tax=Pedobacter sp. AK013 TaxID=2723071 RepID=UPI001620588C|nr:carboxypeptidase-like regulatory domain-containing protein [Pedobacter sp. AK013]MBB6237517.1 hypothetical protein [Pedobacter sp. AK013]
MYLKGLYLYLCLSLLVYEATAQQHVTVHGFVKDSLANPITAASISVIAKNGAGIAFSRSDGRGYFSCVAPHDSLAIKVTALGYEQLVLPIPGNKDQPFNIILKKKVTLLKEVNITSKKKISLESDTLKYNVKAFQDQNDRTIGDLIERLPGIKVDEKGVISYNGKPISKVYLDGDNLLEGRYRLATANVPVNAVMQVQVIERDQPIKALNGYVVTNNVSLNLKLTDSARAITINTGQVALGNKAYSAELSNLILKANIKSINSFKTNNTGENLEHENAEIGVSFNRETSLKTPVSLLALTGAGAPMLAEKYYLKNNDNSINTNALLKLKSDWSLRLNMATLQLKRKYDFNNTADYFIGTDTISYNEIQNHLHRLNQWQVEGQLEKNSKRIYIKSLTRLALPDWKKKGSTIQNGQELTQQLANGYSSLSNETDMVKAFGPNKVLQYNSLVQYYNSNEDLQIFPGVQANMVNNNVAYLKLNQQVQTKSFFMNQMATVKTKFNKVILSVSMGASFERNKLNSGIYKTDSTNLVMQIGEGFKNALTFNNLGLFAKAAAIYPLEKGSISMEAMPTFNFITYDGIIKTVNRNRYFSPNPVIDIRKGVGRYSEFNLRFVKRTAFGELADIYAGNILVNYREFNSNKSPLPKTDLNTLTLRYNYRRPIAMLFYNLNFNYERTKKNFINAFEIDKGLTKSTAIGYENRSHKYTLSSYASKYLFFAGLSLSLNAEATLEKGYTFYNNAISPISVKNINVATTLRKKISTAVTVSVSAETGKFINDQNTINQNIRNTTQVQKFKAIWEHNINTQLSYHFTYNFSLYKELQQQAVPNHFLDFNLKYTPAKWKSYFELQGINVTGENLYKQISISTNQLSVVQVPLRMRTILLKYYFTF